MRNTSVNNRWPAHNPVDGTFIIYASSIPTLVHVYTRHSGECRIMHTAARNIGRYTSAKKNEGPTLEAKPFFHSHQTPFFSIESLFCFPLYIAANSRSARGVTRGPRIESAASYSFFLPLASLASRTPVRSGDSLFHDFDTFSFP